MVIASPMGRSTVASDGRLTSAGPKVNLVEINALLGPESLRDAHALDDARPDAVFWSAAVHRDEEKAAIRRNTQKRARVAAYAEAVVEIRILGVDEPLGVGSDIDVAPPHQPRATADDSGT